MTETIQALLQQRMSDSSIAVKYHDLQWTWREYLAEAAARAAGLIAAADPDRPLHIGSLLGNTPEMLAQMAAAGLGGYVLCGLNTTRRGEALAADIRRAECQIIVTDAENRSLLDGLDLADVEIFDTSTPRWAELVGGAGSLVPHRKVEMMDPFMMIFTSGTSGNPKAVQVSRLMPTFAGRSLTERFGAVGSRHLLCVHAPFSFQCGGRWMGTRGGLGRGDRPGEVLSDRVPGRHSPLSGHLYELRRQATGLHPCHARTRRRRRESAARGFWQRGQ
ncbi:Long-chain-fatty-acid--CoA ligase [Mycobacterium sp. 012931]|uniref:AMP-dependent synthetase/ligase domain-containing protein n=1 Tax=Mycobacterium pseudoshottsii TaxID=265949 RepID=A0A9N7LQ15_9MYCO|nr:Long-chain-fatty-acid--CoA ligase [Mycobacterium sp. 012931]MBC9863435.1 Long-chain-fatty-acid--CoA ligase, Mycobacterial subgroup FadD1 [Mycobacterium pseudoshottsii]BDN82421.1 hypothetical protein NJB1907Z4_C26360 [Mycobacterium pseudoshottsii]